MTDEHPFPDPYAELAALAAELADDAEALVDALPHRRVEEEESDVRHTIARLREHLKEAR